MKTEERPRNVEARIIADSVNPAGKRITSFILTYPRFIHSELMTHRMLSRNAASSRAIPVKKTLQVVQESPAVPEWWGKAQRGMQALEELQGDDLQDCKDHWVGTMHDVVPIVEVFQKLGLHKQIANRVLEPWMKMTSLWTATEWDNFFSLRAHPDAQPEFQVLAFRMLDEFLRGEPEHLSWGEWHLPFVEHGTIRNNLKECIKVSVARAARVSYTTFDGDHSVEKDCELHDRMLAARPIHASPFEHQACAVDGLRWSGNFKGGWQQYRKSIEGEVVKKANLKKIMSNKPDWIEL
jgi:thymidylate synthase ThyX